MNKPLKPSSYRAFEIFAAKQLHDRLSPYFGSISESCRTYYRNAVFDVSCLNIIIDEAFGFILYSFSGGHCEVYNRQKQRERDDETHRLQQPRGQLNFSHIGESLLTSLSTSYDLPNRRSGRIYELNEKVERAD